MDTPDTGLLLLGVAAVILVAAPRPRGKRRAEGEGRSRSLVERPDAGREL